jgi:hypothetical protein
VLTFALASVVVFVRVPASVLPSVAGVRAGVVVLFVYCVLTLMYLLPQLQKIDLVVY